METMVVENSEVEISEEEIVKEISGNSCFECLIPITKFCLKNAI